MGHKQSLEDIGWVFQRRDIYSEQQDYSGSANSTLKQLSPETKIYEVEHGFKPPSELIISNEEVVSNANGTQSISITLEWVGRSDFDFEIEVGEI